MRTKSKSYHEVKIDDITVGFSVTIYSYYSWTHNVISTELIPYPFAIAKIPTLKFRDPWPTSLESPIRSMAQDEAEIRSLLNQMFVDLDKHKVEIINQREGHNLQIKIEDKIYNGFLVHERHLEPNFKQVQILFSNEIFRFDINKPDYEIEAEIVEFLKSK